MNLQPFRLRSKLRRDRAETKWRRATFNLQPSTLNEPARTRRRHAATHQALYDGRVGVEFFERRTSDRCARRRCAAMVLREVRKLLHMVLRLYFRKS